MINADDVTLDMNSHSLSDYPGNGIRMLGDRVTVRNGSLTNVLSGIQSDGNQTLVENMQISNTTYGIIVHGSDSVVRNNHLVNLGAYGIYCRGWTDSRRRNQIIGNSITDFRNALTVVYGIYLTNCGSTTIEDNTLFSARHSDFYTNTSVLGIVIYSSLDVLVVNNRLSQWHRGIWYATAASGGGSTVKYMNNLTTQVRFPFEGGTAVGIND